MMTVLVLGGSVAAGARSTRGWPEFLWERTRLDVINLAESGFRMLDVVRAVPLVPPRSYSAVVIQAGAYDARGGGTPPREFLALVEQAVASCRSRWPEARIVVCTPTPISRECSVSGFNRSARRWVTRVAPEVTRAVGDDALVVDLADLDPGLLADGVHPSRTGASEIARRVALALGVHESP